MQVSPPFDALLNETIEFTTTRLVEPSLPPFDRRIVVTGPPAVKELLSTGNIGTLDALVELLLDPSRVWAAAVALSSATGNEADIVNAFASRPDMWLESVGKNAHERWNKWMAANGSSLVWNPIEKVFVQGIRP